METQTFVMDIDGTISHVLGKEDVTEGKTNYHLANPITPVINKINLLFEQGHTILLFTSRGMRTFKGDVAKIDKYHRPILEEWLNKNNVKYHKLIFGKPWGPNVKYVDDMGLTIDQFESFGPDTYKDCLIENKKKTILKS